MRKKETGCPNTVAPRRGRGTRKEEEKLKMKERTSSIWFLTELPLPTLNSTLIYSTTHQTLCFPNVFHSHKMGLLSLSLSFLTVHLAETYTTSGITQPSLRTTLENSPLPPARTIELYYSTEQWKTLRHERARCVGRSVGRGVSMPQYTPNWYVLPDRPTDRRDAAVACTLA